MTSEEIRAARKELGLTQAQLAALLGYGNYNRVSEVEQGKQKLPRAKAALIQAFLTGYRPAGWPNGATS